MTRTPSRIILAAVSLVAITACHPKVAPTVAPSTPPAAAAAPARPPAPPSRATAANTATPALTDDEIFRRKSLDQLNAEHPLADVFFQYDQSDLGPAARDILQRDAAWLAKFPQTHVAIDGHCDERGTEEYNLALGDRRAETVKSYLVSLGVSANRLDTRSLGKEAPFCRDTGESCWSQNRRDHFLITAK